MPGPLKDEADAFRQAQEQVDTGGQEEMAAGVEKMIDLSFNAKSYVLRQWASNFLNKRFGVGIGLENDDETQAPPGAV